LESTLLENALWFFIGAFSFKLVSYLIGYSQVFILFNDAVMAALAMMVNSDRAFSDCNEVKYETFRKSGMSSEEMDKLKDLDETTSKIWRDAMIESVIKNTPKKLRATLRFRNWDEASDLLHKYLKQVRNR
jgi:hypothetical protein